MAEASGISWTDSTFTPARFGPRPEPPRDGDREQARQRINVLVRTGRLAHPNTLPCKDCGHVWADGERRHEYDHQKGYAAEHHYAVESVCTTCHANRDSLRKAQTHCVKGHQFTGANTILAANGTRHCRECRRAQDRGRRDAAWWREYRRNRGDSFRAARRNAYRAKKAAGRSLDGREHSECPA